jgi:hypothetical protein
LTVGCLGELRHAVGTEGVNARIAPFVRDRPCLPNSTLLRFGPSIVPTGTPRRATITPGFELAQAREAEMMIPLLLLGIPALFARARASAATGAAH